MNSAMFLPQTSEQDIFKAGNKQADDINSVIEYVRVALGYDKTADDEDDDNGQNFQMARPVDYFFEQDSFLTEPQTFVLLRETYPGYLNARLRAVNSDIVIPPPKA